MSKASILVVEDDRDIAELVEYNLVREGYAVSLAEDGESAVEQALKLNPALVVLDLMLPTIDGLEVCRRLRQHPATQQTPVIMVTAKGEESDVVLGLGLGADDYIAKPFKPHELVARTRAVLRRTRQAAVGKQDQRAVVAGALRIDPSSHRATLEGQELPLTATEFRILHFLASRPGRVFTRDQILAASIGANVVVLERNIDVHIRSIRKKLGAQRDLIETVRSIGYRFAEPSG
jgi:two-component system phosphate regulon response regulator PhoB